MVSSDIPEYAQNKTSLPPLAAAIDLRGPIGRDGKRTSAGRRSARQDPLDRLRALPEIRPIPWYPGKELPPEKSILSDRVQTRSACLMASRGRINDPPCTHCATGLGRFSMCISLDEFLSGACSTCHLAARGNSCSIRLKVASSTALHADRVQLCTDHIQVSNPEENNKKIDNLPKPILVRIEHLFLPVRSPNLYPQRRQSHIIHIKPDAPRNNDGHRQQLQHCGHQSSTRIRISSAREKLYKEPTFGSHTCPRIGPLIQVPVPRPPYPGRRIVSHQQTLRAKRHHC